MGLSNYCLCLHWLNRAEGSYCQELRKDSDLILGLIIDDSGMQRGSTHEHSGFTDKTITLAPRDTLSSCPDHEDKETPGR